MLKDGMHAQEYGMPSTHTMNSLVLNGYAVYYLLQRDYLQPAVRTVSAMRAALLRGRCGSASRASTWACTRRSTSPAAWRPES